MRKVLIFLDDETGDKLKRHAVETRRSVKAMAEKIVIDRVNPRSDGLTDSDYVRLTESRRK